MANFKVLQTPGVYDQQDNPTGKIHTVWVVEYTSGPHTGEKAVIQANGTGDKPYAVGVDKVDRWLDAHHDPPTQSSATSTTGTVAAAGTSNFHHRDEPVKQKPSDHNSPAGSGSQGVSSDSGSSSGFHHRDDPANNKNRGHGDGLSLNDSPRSTAHAYTYSSWEPDKKDPNLLERNVYLNGKVVRTETTAAPYTPGTLGNASLPASGGTSGNGNSGGSGTAAGHDQGSQLQTHDQTKHRDRQDEPAAFTPKAKLDPWAVNATTTQGDQLDPWARNALAENHEQKTEITPETPTTPMRHMPGAGPVVDTDTGAASTVTYTPETPTTPMRHMPGAGPVVDTDTGSTSAFVQSSTSNVVTPPLSPYSTTVDYDNDLDAAAQNTYQPPASSSVVNQVSSSSTVNPPLSPYSTTVNYDNDIDAAAQNTYQPPTSSSSYTPTQYTPALPAEESYFDGGGVTLPGAPSTPESSPPQPFGGFDTTQGANRFSHTPVD
jgi:hypothetical protein